MEEEIDLTTISVRGQELTVVPIGESKWCCFVEICSKLLPLINRTSIHNRVNRSKARMVLADKAAVAALKRKEVITKHTGKVYLISVDSIPLVLSLFDESESRDSLPAQESGLEDEDGEVNQAVECGEICNMDDDVGAEEIVPEAGNHEEVDDGEGDDNSDEEETGDGKFEEESSQDLNQDPSAATSAPVRGPGRGRRRCPDCSNIVKSNQPTCGECGKRLFTPGRKRRSGLQGASYARRMKRRRLDAKEPIEEDDDGLESSKVIALVNERPRRWRKWCGICRAACASSVSACPRCGNAALRESGASEPGSGTGGGGGSSVSLAADEENDAEDGEDMNEGGEEGMDIGNGDEDVGEEGPKPKGRSKWCRHCALYMPENCTECTECGRPVKRKYRRRCATIASRPTTAKRRAALVARATTISGTPRHRTDVEDSNDHHGDNGDQGMVAGSGGGQTGKWCSRCQKSAPPLVTHCLICGKELKRVYRKRSAIWQQNQQQQAEEQQERIQERRKAGIKGLAAVAGGYEVTGSNGQHLNWTQRYNLTSFIPDDEHMASGSDGARPVVTRDNVEVHGGRAVVRKAELRRHDNFMPRNAMEAVGLSKERPLLRRPIVELPPVPTAATDREKLHYAQCFLDIKMGVSQSDLVRTIHESRQRHQNAVDSAARSFEGVDTEWHMTRERTTELQCQARSLEKKLASLRKQLGARKRDMDRLSRLSRQTDSQEQLYGRIAQRFHKRYLACQELLDGDGKALAASAASSTAQGTAKPLPRATLSPRVGLASASTQAASSATQSTQPASVPMQQHPQHPQQSQEPGAAPSNPAKPEAVNPAVADLAPEAWAHLQSQARQLPREVHQPSVALVS